MCLCTFIQPFGVSRVAVFFLLTPLMDSMLVRFAPLAFQSIAAEVCFPGPRIFLWVSLLDLPGFVFDFVDY